jgi:hypothetical protein
VVEPDVLQALYMDRVGPDGQRLNARARAKYRPVGEREDLAVEAHLSLHPLATEGELEAVRAAERAKSRNSTPYFDFTVSAAKSVSVLHASYLVAARQARKQGARADAEKLEAAAADIVAALMAAARAAVARVERALYVRTGYHSTGTGEYRDAAGATVAMFAQHTSREGDPQLHVHMAVMNLAQRGDAADGKWRTLHSQMLYQERLAVAAYAARELATRLTDLGYHLVPRADGNGFEIGGVDPGVMEAFSSRRAQITPEVERMAQEYRLRYGREPSQRTLWAMAQDATLETRKPKARAHGAGPGQAPAKSAGEELDAWESCTTEREISALSAVHGAVARHRPAEGTNAPEELDARSRARIIRIAVAEAQKCSAAWTRAALLWELHRTMPAMAAGVDQVALAEELADEALAGGGAAEVIRLGPAPDVTDVSSLGVRASDGQSVYTPPGQERYTTAAWLDLEEYLVAQARREVTQLVTAAQATATLDGTDLDEPQREVAIGLLTARTATSVLMAPAGAGKTHTITAFARAWTAWTGRRVIGLTASTNASRVMRGDGLTTRGLAEAYNIAQFLGRLKDGGSRGAMRIARDDVLVIDEASQISTTDLAAIQAVATAAGARIVLTGDTAQLGAVEAGGMMRLIASDLGHWELAEVRRFDAEWERLASLQLRRGERAALHAYDARGRIRGGPQPQAQAEAVELYLADYLLSRDVLLLAGTNEEAARLAAQVREQLVKLGQVPARPEVILADGNGAATGDLMRARLNTHLDAAGQPLSNRDTLRLVGWAGTGETRVAIVQRQLSADEWSREFPIPADYLHKSAELAYAGNVYVAQGRTVDTAHLYVSPTLTRETLYVGMTRAREANTAHVATGPAQAPGQEPMAQAQPEAVLADILDHVASGTTATEAMREAQAFATSTRHLFTMWSAASRAQAYTDIDAALAARLTPYEYARYQGEPQRPVVQRQILAATLSGAALEDVADVATRDDMRGARSIAAVMHGRLKAAGIGQARRGQTMTWAERTPVAARRGVAGHLAEAMDARREDLGRRLYEQPERWILTHLGPPPPEGSSPALIADWQTRAGIAASYREAAGIEDPDVAIGSAPQGHPELAEAYAATLLALEIPDVDAQVRAMTRGELERDVAAYHRLKATAPAEPSRELRAASITEVNGRAAAVRLQAAGQAKAAAARQLHADAASAQASELESRLETYQRWEEATAEDRARADRATKELARRGQEPRPEIGRHATAEAGQERPAREPMSLVDQVRRDMVNLAALEAKLENDAGPRECQPEPRIESAELAPPDPKHQAALNAVDAALAAAAEVQTEAAQRDASREAYMLQQRQAEAEATGPSAWVPGPHTPTWGGPAPYREQQPAPDLEAEASL